MRFWCQVGNHDSIEDARTALTLYRKYEQIVQQGQSVLQHTLEKLYADAPMYNFRVPEDGKVKHLRS